MFMNNRNVNKFWALVLINYMSVFVCLLPVRSVGVASATNITNSVAMKNDKIFIMKRQTKPAVLKPK